MSLADSLSLHSGFANGSTDLAKVPDVLRTNPLLEPNRQATIPVERSPLLEPTNSSTYSRSQKGKKVIVTGHHQRINGTSRNDILDARRGKGNNILNGGKGNDQLLAKWKDVLYGGAGDDVLDVSKGRGMNVLRGDAGDDILLAGSGDKLFGGAGSDALWAKDGSSVLTGGAGTDRFWISRRGSARITDFQVNTDLVGVIDASGIGQFEDLLLSQQNANTVVKFQGKTITTLVGVSVQNLNQNNFTFVQSEGEALEVILDQDLDGNSVVGGKVQPKFNLSLDYSTYESLIKQVRGNLNLGSRYDTDGNGSKDYQVDAIFDDAKSGFYAVGFTSISGDKPPILVVRGSELGGAGNAALMDLLEDANPKGIGFGQFVANKNKVETWLRNTSQDISKNPSLSLPVITGESLGGAIAQLVASSYTQTNGKLSQVSTFNAPGIADDLASAFKAVNVGKVTHVVAYGDIVSLVGQEYLPGEYWLLDWNTPDKDVALILPYMLDKHNQEEDDLIGNSAISFKTRLNTSELSSSQFSYWNRTGISGNARRDWALFNLELGILSRGILPGILANRGIAEFSRANLGVLLREALEKRSDSLFANTILSAGRAVDALGDVLVDSISHWNNEFWASVAKWSPELWSAIELSGLPAISFLNIGGVAAAEALASGGLSAATSLIAGGAEAFEALAGGGYKALQALASGDGKLAWDALSKGGKIAWQALTNRGSQGWDELVRGGETAWKALETSGQDAWNSLAKGGEKAWSAIASGIASKTFIINGAEYFQKLTSLGEVFEQLETLPGGKQIETAFQNGTGYLRKTFENGLETLREEWLSGGRKLEIAFQSGGKQIETYFQNGTSYLRNTFVNGANTLKEEWLSGGKKIETAFQNGTGYLRKTFENGLETLREEWLSGGRKLEIAFQSGGKQIETYFQNGTSYLRNTFVNGANTLKEEWLSGGKKIETAFQNGTSYLRKTFENGLETLREEWLSGGRKLEIAFQSGGKQIETYFQNGTSYLRNTFVNGVNTFREEWRSGGRYVENYFNQGKNTLRQTFQNGKEVLRQTWEASGNYVEQAWDSAGNFLGSKVFNSVGQLISGASSTVNSWIDTVKSWF